MNCANDINGCTQKYQGYFTVQRYPYYLAHKAAGLSWMTIEHNSQIAWDGFFQRWNYGTNDANLAIYGEMKPPLYNLGNVRFPVAVFYTTEQFKGDIDEYLLDPTMSKLQTVVYRRKFTFPYESFYLGIDQSWFSKEVIPLIEKYDPYKNGPVNTAI